MSHTTVVTCGGAVQMCHNCSPGVEIFLKNVRTLYPKSDGCHFGNQNNHFRLLGFLGHRNSELPNEPRWINFKVRNKLQELRQAIHDMYS